MEFSLPGYNTFYRLESWIDGAPIPNRGFLLVGISRYFQHSVHQLQSENRAGVYVLLSGPYLRIIQLFRSRLKQRLALHEAHDKRWVALSDGFEIRLLEQ
jgi:hypothetical protein